MTDTNDRLLDNIPTTTNLYSILNLTTNATDTEIKQAYKRCCFKYHPDKNLNDKQGEAAKMFRMVSDAFFILSDSILKKKYDMYGIEGIKEYIEGERNKLSTYDSKKVFETFFGDDNLFGNMGLYDIDFQSKQHRKREQKLQMDTVYHDLPCTLEELCLGAEKVVTVTRKRYLAESKSLIDESKVLKVKLEPSWKTGMQISMHKEGDEDEEREAGDLVFTIKEIPHQYFQKDNDNNLIFHAKITLCEALTDCIIRVPTLSGKKTLVVPCPELIHHNYEKRLLGQGIPSHQNELIKGDLIIRFDIEFPKVIPLETKRQLKKLLSVT